MTDQISWADIEKGGKVSPTTTNSNPIVTKEGASSYRQSWINKILAPYALVVGTISLIVGSIALSQVNENSAALGQLSRDISVVNADATKNKAALEGSTTLFDIKQRGVLNCGINLSPGFAYVAEHKDGKPQYAGFEVDLCRAISAAIFGDFSNPDKNIEYTVVNGNERFKSLHAQEVDLLASAATHTMDRDVYMPHIQSGLSFSMPYFYDSHSFAGKEEYVECAEAFDTSGDCKLLKVCTPYETTAHDQLEDVLPSENIVVKRSIEETITGLLTGDCNTIYAGSNAVSEIVLRVKGNETDETVSGKEFSSHEPLALVTREDDPRFSNFVNWIVHVLMNAEQQGVAQKDYSRVSPEIALFGRTFARSFQDAIRAVGNYEEIYERNLVKLVPRNGLNKINEGSTGRILGQPFGSLLNRGGLFHPGSLLDEIKTRGFVSCGIKRRAGFADFDPTTSTWSGIDVDLCRALSAAIFDGVENNIVIHSLTAMNQFGVFHSGLVDVLTQVIVHPFEGDILESMSEMRLTHTQPYFYDGLSFAGIEHYGKCADNLDTTTPECKGLKICVTDGTPSIARASELFPQENIVPMPTIEDARASLVSGGCNALAGGSQDIAAEGVLGMMENYDVGLNRYTKEPLALVTRQDDAIWSDFVYWVLEAAFRAEEDGITKNTAAQNMPATNLFGPLYRDMLKNSVQAVGNYGELYSRNLEAIVPRSGLNLMNNGNEPQLLAFDWAAYIE